MSEQTFRELTISGPPAERGYAHGAALAAEITESLRIPVIGIGAGPACDGQVLVLHDALGVTAGKRPRFVRDFLRGGSSVLEAVQAYVDAVKDGSFPGPEHTYQ